MRGPGCLPICWNACIIRKHFLNLKFLASTLMLRGLWKWLEEERNSRRVTLMATLVISLIGGGWSLFVYLRTSSLPPPTPSAANALLVPESATTGGVEPSAKSDGRETAIPHQALPMEVKSDSAEGADIHHQVLQSNSTTTSTRTVEIKPTQEIEICNSPLVTVRAWPRWNSVAQTVTGVDIEWQKDRRGLWTTLIPEELPKSCQIDKVEVYPISRNDIIVELTVTEATSKADK